MPLAWRNTGGDTARVVFLYNPALAGGYIEEMFELPPRSNLNLWSFRRRLPTLTRLLQR